MKTLGYFDTLIIVVSFESEVGNPQGTVNRGPIQTIFSQIDTLKVGIQEGFEGHDIGLGSNLIPQYENSFPQKRITILDGLYIR
jgi:hypothetical protein